MRRTRERRRAAGIPDPETARRLVVETLAGYPRGAREKLLDTVCRRVPCDQQPGVRAMVRELLGLSPPPADPRQYDLVVAAAAAVCADADAALARLSNERQQLGAVQADGDEQIKPASQALDNARRARLDAIEQEEAEWRNRLEAVRLSQRQTV
jgi:hypothetical protein